MSQMSKEWDTYFAYFLKSIIPAMAGFCLTRTDQLRDLNLTFQALLGDSTNLEDAHRQRWRGGSITVFSGGRLCPLGGAGQDSQSLRIWSAG